MGVLQNKVVIDKLSKIVGDVVKPSGTYEITNNGEYDITEYAKVNVNVVSDEDRLKKILNATKSTSYFFNGCSLSDVSDYISYGDTSNVTNMSYMFNKCSKLKIAPNLDTTKVTDMSNMFYSCGLLESIQNYNTYNVTNMKSMFSRCYKLKSFPQLDTANVTNMSSMFDNCTELTEVSLLNTRKVEYFNGTFYNCNKLEKIDIPYFNSNSAAASSNMCQGCASLKTLIIREFGGYILGSNAFFNCHHMLGTANALYNPDGLKDGYLYVPRSMVTILSSDAEWSAYNLQIRALEDYTVDGTTTGELDETKI